jgi:hypothetical protein
MSCLLDSGVFVVANLNIRAPPPHTAQADHLPSPFWFFISGAAAEHPETAALRLTQPGPEMHLSALVVLRPLPFLYSLNRLPSSIILLLFNHLPSLQSSSPSSVRNE